MTNHFLFPGLALHILLVATVAEGQELLTTANDTNNATATTPICTENESLFRLELITGAENSWGAPASYRISTESSSEIHAECSQCPNRFPGADIQLCLPKDQCHTAVVGRGIGRWISCYNGGVEELVMTWGEEVLLRNNAYLFESIDFGSGCQEKYCDDENESEFEFFLDRHREDPFPFAWELNGYTAGEGDESTGTLLRQSQAPYNQSALIYERLCVPRESCLEFYMGYPSNWTEPFYDPNMYSVRLDGVFYRENDLRMGLDLVSGEDKLNETVKLGKSCTVHNACNSSTESLVELEFKVKGEVACTSRSNDFEFTSAITNSDFPFWLEDQENNDYNNWYVWDNNWYVWAGDYEDFEVDQSYSFVGCIPKERCAVLNVGSDIPASYKVYQDGVEMTQRVFNTEGTKIGTTTTNLGDCPSASGAALRLSRGILVVAVAFTAFLSHTVFL